MRPTRAAPRDHGGAHADADSSIFSRRNIGERTFVTIVFDLLLASDSSSKDSELGSADRNQHEEKIGNMATPKETLSKMMEIDGCLGGCIVDSNSGMMLGAAGGGNVNLELAAAGNTEVVRSKRKTIKALGLQDQIEDILITLGKQYHLIRPLGSNDSLFIYLVLDRARANLAMARHVLREIEKELAI